MSFVFRRSRRRVGGGGGAVDQNAGLNKTSPCLFFFYCGDIIGGLRRFAEYENMLPEGGT